MPTLLEKDKIVKQPWMSEQERRKIENQRSIDYIIEWLAARTWEGKSSPPRIKLTGPGDRVLVLRSGTGSGKSTTLPPEIFRKFFSRQKKNIIVTQPTRATTTDIPYQILQYNNDILKLGDTIGYQTGTIARKPVKGILFCTTGILLQFLKTLDDESFMKKYGWIIIDEVHQRSMDTDMTLFYLKQLITRQWENPDCPFIILTSGTFEPKIFMDYFSCPENHFIDVLGATFPTSDSFTKFSLSNYIDYTVDLIEKLHIENIADITNNTVFRDILVFVQGKQQIVEIANRIHALNAIILNKTLEEIKEHSDGQQLKYKTGGGDKEFNSYPVYYLAPIALMSENISKGSKEYMDLYSDIDSVVVDIYRLDKKMQPVEVLYQRPASRRVMIGTNAIETGLTIDTLKYCIDTGYVKESQFNPNYGCNVLVDKCVTQASSRQRRGRVGRKSPGEFYACYTRDTYDKLQPLPFPDIVKEDISQFLLSVIINECQTSIIPCDKDHCQAITPPDELFHIDKFEQLSHRIEHKMPFTASNLDFIQYPSADSMGFAVEKLYGLGFIDNEYKPTIFGLYASKFRKLRLEHIRCILACYHHGANVLDLITIICMAQFGRMIIKKRKYKPRNILNLTEKQTYYYHKLIFADELIEYLFIWDEIQQKFETIEQKISDHKEKISPMHYLENYCAENNFSLDGIYQVIELRDEIINDMLTMGLNPYYNGLNLPRGKYRLVQIIKNNLMEGMEEIIKIKKCLYEGLRFNVCHYKEDRRIYVNIYSGQRVFIDSELIKSTGGMPQKKPQKILLNDIMLRESQMSKGMYEFYGSDVSVLDGYVPIDNQFLNH